VQEGKEMKMSAFSEAILDFSSQFYRSELPVWLSFGCHRDYQMTT